MHSLAVLVRGAGIARAECRVVSLDTMPLPHILVARPHGITAPRLISVHEDVPRIAEQRFDQAFVFALVEPAF